MIMSMVLTMGKTSALNNGDWEICQQVRTKAED